MLSQSRQRKIKQSAVFSFSFKKNSQYSQYQHQRPAFDTNKKEIAQPTSFSGIEYGADESARSAPFSPQREREIFTLGSTSFYTAATCLGAAYAVEQHLRRHSAALCDLLDALDESRGFAAYYIPMEPSANQFRMPFPLRSRCALSNAPWRPKRRRRSTVSAMSDACRPQTSGRGTAPASASCSRGLIVRNECGTRCTLKICLNAGWVLTQSDSGSSRTSR